MNVPSPWRFSSFTSTQSVCAIFSKFFEKYMLLLLTSASLPSPAIICFHAEKSIEGLNNYDVLKFFVLLLQDQLPMKLDPYKLSLLTRLYWSVLLLFLDTPLSCTSVQFCTTCTVQIDSQEKLHRDNSNYHHKNPQHTYQIIFMTQSTEAVERVSNCSEVVPMEMLLSKSLLVIRADRGYHI